MIKSTLHSSIANALSWNKSKIKSCSLMVKTRNLGLDRIKTIYKRQIKCTANDDF